jgi:hypothetical protein
VPWGGWDPFLDPLFNANDATARRESTPVLTFFVPESARRSLQRFLANSRSLGVQAVLQTRPIEATTQFIPATRPGGQTLDAVILLTALLYQGEHLSPSLQREVRDMAEAALAARSLGALETFYLDLLSLGKRLDWVQLSSLLRTTDSAKTVGEYAHLARLASDNLPLIATAALFSTSADRVAAYLIQYGKRGLDDLRLALSHGQGAVQHLLRVQQPVHRDARNAPGFTASLALRHPRLALAVKYLGFLLGAFCLFRGLERRLIAPNAWEAPLRVRSGALAALTALLLILATEPFLFAHLPLSEFRLKLALPVLAQVTSVPPSQPPASPPAMDTTTLISIGFFAALQVGMYLLCLMKIRDVSRQTVSPLVKLRLMENEENLFDGGLYIGIGGTAAALVLQVLGVIQPNLLAAYSSNLFGITCVALVKIRHVRPYKRQLILESQATTPAPSLVPAKVPAPAS